MAFVNMNETIKPTITTIIPTYRRPQQLMRAIRSVLNQTYPHFQVCVYDNASGDETALVVDEMAKADPRVKYYCHSENIGSFNNFQYGLEHVETLFFSFLSDDDIVLPKFYETALDGFAKHHDAMFSATDVFHMNLQGNVLKTALSTWTPGFYHPPDGLMAILEHGHSEWTGILFRKAVTKDIGFLDVETGKFSDLDFELRIAAQCPFVVSTRPCAIFYHPCELREADPFDVRWQGLLKMIRNLTNDKRLPLYVRTYAERALLGRFEKIIFRAGFIYLCRKNISDAEKVAAVLRDEFGRLALYIALSAIINIYKYVPFAHLVFDCLYICHKYIQTKHIKSYQKHLS